jgi:hypothetical protein
MKHFQAECQPEVKREGPPDLAQLKLKLAGSKNILKAMYFHQVPLSYLRQPIAMEFPKL